MPRPAHDEVPCDCQECGNAGGIVVGARVNDAVLNSHVVVMGGDHDRGGTRIAAGHTSHDVRRLVLAARRRTAASAPRTSRRGHCKRLRKTCTVARSEAYRLKLAHDPLSRLRCLRGAASTSFERGRRQRSDIRHQQRPIDVPCCGRSFGANRWRRADRLGLDGGRSAPRGTRHDNEQACTQDQRTRRWSLVHRCSVAALVVSPSESLPAASMSRPANRGRRRVVSGTHSVETVQ